MVRPGTLILPFLSVWPVKTTLPLLSLTVKVMPLMFPSSDCLIISQVEVVGLLVKVTVFVPRFRVIVCGLSVVHSYPSGTISVMRSLVPTGRSVMEILPLASVL